MKILISLAICFFMFSMASVSIATVVEFRGTDAYTYTGTYDSSYSNHVTLHPLHSSNFTEYVGDIEFSAEFSIPVNSFSLSIYADCDLFVGAGVNMTIYDGTTSLETYSSVVWDSLTSFSITNDNITSVHLTGGYADLIPADIDPVSWSNMATYLENTFSFQIDNATCSANTASVPGPSTTFFLGTCLVSLLGIRIKNKRF